MKRPILIGVTLLSLAASTVACSSGAEDGARSCSLSTLSGRYEYEMSGERRIEGQVTQYVEVGKESYDGKGGITNSYTDTDSKQVSEVTGTYELGKNCQGVAAYAGSDSYRIWVSPDGSHLSFLLDDAEGKEPALSGSEERSSTDPGATCSTESLKGTYTYDAHGVRLGGLPYVETGFETFDGTGKVTRAIGNSNTTDTDHKTATYTLGKDCLAKVDYGNGDTYTGFVAADGSRFHWLQTGGAGAGDFFAGLDERLTTSMLTGLA